MTSIVSSPFLNALAERWWALVIRGIAALLFGVLAVVAPGISLLVLVTVWGAYALVDGVFSLVLAARGTRAGWSSGWLIFEGIAGVIAGVLTFVWPGITAMVLLVVIAVWAVFTGLAEVASAIHLRRHIRGEWLLGATGILSIVFGVVLLVWPGAGALALLWMIGAYAFVFGGLLIGLGLRLRGEARRGEREHPTGGGLPSPA